MYCAIVTFATVTTQIALKNNGKHSESSPKRKASI